MHSVLRSTNLKTVKLTKTMKQTALFSESHSANSCSGEQTQQQPNNIKTLPAVLSLLIPAPTVKHKDTKDLYH